MALATLEVPRGLETVLHRLASSKSSNLAFATLPWPVQKYL